jgi:hypothetical protein
MWTLPGSNDRIYKQTGDMRHRLLSKAMPNAIVASGLSYYSVPGTAFRYVYQSSIGLMF